MQNLPPIIANNSICGARVNFSTSGTCIILDEAEWRLRLPFSARKDFMVVVSICVGSIVMMTAIFLITKLIVIV